MDEKIIAIDKNRELRFVKKNSRVRSAGNNSGMLIFKWVSPELSGN
jgi:hypothetical protein